MVDSSFGFAKPEDSLGFLLWQTTVTWQRLIKNALEPYNISHAQFVILALLLWLEEANQEPIQTFIVGKTKLDKMTVSKALKKLAVEGFVVRGEDTQDTRAKLVSLTKEGRSLVKKLIKIVESIDKDFFKVLTDKEQKVLIKNLNNLVR